MRSANVATSRLTSHARSMPFFKASEVMMTFSIWCHLTPWPMSMQNPKVRPAIWGLRGCCFMGLSITMTIENTHTHTRRLCITVFCIPLCTYSLHMRSSKSTSSVHVLRHVIDGHKIGLYPRFFFVRGKVSPKMTAAHPSSLFLQAILIPIVDYT